ncbi:glyoxalase [Egibacter rhizosphaerae]|uniref:Glyoxalase n=1 Tax=Egibacter rhizosphaerae TaxID=1670831 RepID=A0A411YIU8_9ACTN|nr:VOC family protein [Egibacter rhizosphaerae]QBI21049.1 glyoxalase [Egibacter rhizosphaerae]
MTSAVIPTLRYHDAPKAIDWLVEAFGFERQFVVEGAGGRIDHAQLTFGDGMLMCGSHDDGGDYGDFVSTVRLTGAPTGGFYVRVDDVNAHAERAQQAGAEIVQPPEDQDYGGRRYTCRDIEGNVWTFGDYDPWAT